MALAILDDDMDQQSIEESINSQSLELSYSPGDHAAFETGTDQARVVYPQSTDISEQLPGLLHNMILREHDRYGLWWHEGSTQVSAQTVVAAEMPTASTYLDLMMDEDLLAAPQSSAKEVEVDYLDELLSS